MKRRPTLLWIVSLNPTLFNLLLEFTRQTAEMLISSVYGHPVGAVTVDVFLLLLLHPDLKFALPEFWFWQSYPVDIGQIHRLQ